MEDTCEVIPITDVYKYQAGDIVNVPIPIDVYGEELPMRLYTTEFTVLSTDKDGSVIHIATGSEEDFTLETFLMPREHLEMNRKGGEVDG